MAKARQNQQPNGSHPRSSLSTDWPLFTPPFGPRSRRHSQSGKYDESKVDIWSVCVKNNHVIHLGEEYEQYLQTQLGMKDAQDWNDVYGDYGKWTMLSEFRQERNQIQSLQNYFSNRTGHRIHAVGAIGMDNQDFHLKYGEDPEYVVYMLWRDMYYRKMIPEILYDHSEGISEIICEHV